MLYLLFMVVLRQFLRLLLFILVFPPLIYFLAVIIGALIPVNVNPRTEKPYAVVYLVSNGMHTDIVLPVRNEVIDWTEVVNPSHSLSSPVHPKFISFGWGDLEFYRNTPQWEDLDIATGFRALFLKTPSAVHVKFLDTVSVNDKTINIVTDREQYKKLSTYI